MGAAQALHTYLLHAVAVGFILQPKAHSEYVCRIWCARVLLSRECITLALGFQVYVDRVLMHKHNLAIAFDLPERALLNELMGALAGHFKLASNLAYFHHIRELLRACQRLLQGPPFASMPLILRVYLGMSRDPLAIFLFDPRVLLRICLTFLVDLFIVPLRRRL